jgi:chemotaxis protein methyltransferase CheR
MLPKAQEWDAFYAQMKQRTKLDLHDYKANQLQRRIVGMMEVRGCKNLEEFWKNLTSTPDGITWFQDKLAINVSELFRNPEKWKEVESKIIPDLLSRSKMLKCWSAGCSYGAEAHSLAAVLHEKFPGAHQVIGTDIDQAALTQAKAGEFCDNDMRCVPNEYRKYFVKTGQIWHAVPEIRRSLKFSEKNILLDGFDSNFDLIMCRNVVIYFTEEAKEKLYQRFFKALKPGGFLFVGSTERVAGHDKIGFEQPTSFFYQKPVSGETKWRNAS